MSQVITLKKGFEINLSGKASKQEDTFVKSPSYAVKPTSFHGITRPKLLVKEGDQVLAGTPIFYDKMAEKVMHTAPHSGIVSLIKRGEKRKLLEIQITAESDNAYESFEAYGSDFKDVPKKEIVEQLLSSGLWTHIIQRPYGTIANHEDAPKAIFISGFDSHPLAPDYPELLKENADEFAAGIRILKAFSEKVHLSEKKGQENATAYGKAEGVVKHVFNGVHPIGNVGVQIHHIEPINKGDIVWTVNPQSVVFIGRLFITGQYNTLRKMSICGSEVKEPKAVTAFLGLSAKALLQDQLKNDNVRVISGNVLTGEGIDLEGYVNHTHHMVTVIPEGDYQELFGWITPTTRPSFHKAWGLFSWLKGTSELKVDTNVHGQDRAFVMTGAFEKVVPMDIMPTYLLKSILAEDYDGMEQLGIYEVIEEDLALCEFIDVSKHDVQKILREGLDLLQNS